MAKGGGCWALAVGLVLSGCLEGEYGYLGIYIGNLILYNLFLGFYV